MGFSRQEYWSGLPCPSPEDLPDPGLDTCKKKTKNKKKNSAVCMSHLNPSVVSVGFWERLQQPFFKTWALTSCFLFFFFILHKASGYSGFFSSCGVWGLCSSCGAWASHCSGFSSCGPWALGHRLNSLGTWASLLLGMWDLWSGIKPISPELADRSFTTEPPGKPKSYFKKRYKLCYIHK